jgi:RHS repeat-associated protein
VPGSGGGGVDDPQATNPAGWTASTYSYSTTIPHAVTSIAIESGGMNTYTYDANGNMTCRIENSVTYTHAYNAENRASSISKRNTNCTGTIIESWSFAYDGDGTRVMTAHFTGTQGTPDSVTSYYMGGAYEVKDGAAKKYYSIAGMMVATQDASGLQYLLTDHLGSTVAVTNSSGTLTSQQRYLPFGAPRLIPNSPIAGTDFTYTGQRMLDSGMGGIMDFRARLYSPYINRFTQPDTIIPNPANPQSWNRYSYVTNRPVNFNDPSGYDPHWCADDRGYNINDSCLYNWLDDNTTGDHEEILFTKYDVTVQSLTRSQKRATMGAIYAIGNKLARARGNSETAAEAFVAEFSPVEVVFDPNCFNCRNVTACGNQMSGTVIYEGEEINCTPGGAYSPPGGNQIIIASLARWSVNNMVHEFGHVYDHQRGDQPRNMSATLVANRALFLRANPCAGCFLWQFNTSRNEGETFGDMFVAWVFDVWNTDPLNAGYVSSARDWMNAWMPP